MNYSSILFVLIVRDARRPDDGRTTARAIAFRRFTFRLFTLFRPFTFRLFTFRRPTPR